MHSCSTLRGSSGGIILDSNGRFVGIHIGTFNSRKTKQNQLFFNKETFNKFLPVTSTAFREFIKQSILPNIDNDELAQKWGF
jgi:V8-like Glu-specific endopeptidase